MTLRIAVIGATGRMGRALVKLLSADDRDAANGERGELVAAVARGSIGRDAGEVAGIGCVGVPVTDLAALGAAKIDVAIDFSTPQATEELLDFAVTKKFAIVSGTTGLESRGMQKLERASRYIPVLSEPNMSIGVHVLTDLVSRAVAQLGADYDIEIVETHHRRKVDAPSGTALKLADAAAKARSRSTEFMHGRVGKPGPRRGAEIGMHAVRGGDVIGDHTVMLLGEMDRIELTHRASNRDVFARGAIVAALAIAKKPAGRYTMRHVVAQSSKREP